MFDSKAIQCLISLNNFTHNTDASRSVSSPELRVSKNNTGKESVSLPFRIRESLPTVVLKMNFERPVKTALNLGFLRQLFLQLIDENSPGDRIF